jgi:hypothetical protein
MCFLGGIDVSGVAGIRLPGLPFAQLAAPNCPHRGEIEKPRPVVRITSPAEERYPQLCVFHARHYRSGLVVFILAHAEGRMDHRWAGARLIERPARDGWRFGAREMMVTEAAQAAGLPAGVLRSRPAAGWSVADALTKPVDPRGVKNAPR